jgi:Protein of unknown function (DUF4199)
MKNNTVKIGIGFALAWCVIKYAYFLYDPLAEIKPMVMLNILFMLSCIAVALFLVKRSDTEETNALYDIKNAMRAGFPYTVVVAIFLYFYYAKINPEYNAHQISNMEYEMKKVIDDPVKLEELKKSNEGFEVKTKEEIFAEMKKGPRTFYTPGAVSTISLLSMLLLSTLYSILVTVVYRRIVFR